MVEVTPAGYLYVYLTINWNKLVNFYCFVDNYFINMQRDLYGYDN